ncbi:hypothetical protein N9Z98_02955, partial [Akkermansiaceae bacterium]|nr:hypothetical protein [Akkermansiaceae bacterium]
RLEYARDAFGKKEAAATRGLKIDEGELKRIFESITLVRDLATGSIDSMGRFDEAGIAWETDVPWVDLAGEKLLNSASIEDQGRPNSPAGFRVLITHDIDRTTPCEPYSLVNAVASQYGIRKGKWFATKEALDRNLIIRTIDKLIEFERAQGIRACYFMMSGPYGLRRYSTRTNIRWRSAREVARLVGDGGMELGLHGSYAAMDNSSYDQERQRLEDVVERRVRWHRNHYLRFDPLRMAHQLEGARFEADFSYGYVGRMGFRAGTAQSYSLYNFVEERKSGVLEVPMLLMDTVLWGADRDRLLEGFRNHLEWVKLKQGCVSLNFHPETFLFDDSAWGFFSNVVGICRDMGADMTGEISADPRHPGSDF